MEFSNLVPVALNDGTEIPNASMVELMAEIADAFGGGSVEVRSVASG